MPVERRPLLASSLPLNINVIKIYEPLRQRSDQTILTLALSTAQYDRAWGLRVL